MSKAGNEQHNPGKPLHWDRSKSGDEADALMRHFVERGTLDTDGIRHSAKVAWRALALLQKEIEAADHTSRAVIAWRSVPNGFDMIYCGVDRRRGQAQRRILYDPYNANARRSCIGDRRKAK